MIFFRNVHVGCVPSNNPGKKGNRKSLDRGELGTTSKREAFGHEKRKREM